MISVEKPVLPRDLSYVLKTSMLEEALRSAGIDCDIYLRYWSAGDSILEAEYWLPNDRVPNPRVFTRAGSVPAKLRRPAVDQMKAVVLPQFVAWLAKIVVLPENSTVQRARVHAAPRAEHLEIEPTVTLDVLVGVARDRLAKEIGPPSSCYKHEGSDTTECFYEFYHLPEG